MDRIPNEMLFDFFLFLNREEVEIIQLVNKKWNSLVLKYMHLLPLYFGLKLEIIWDAIDDKCDLRAVINHSYGGNQVFLHDLYKCRQKNAVEKIKSFQYIVFDSLVIYRKMQFEKLLNILSYLHSIVGAKLKFINIFIEDSFFTDNPSYPTIFSIFDYITANRLKKTMSSEDTECFYSNQIIAPKNLQKLKLVIDGETKEQNRKIYKLLKNGEVKYARKYAIYFHYFSHIEIVKKIIELYMNAENADGLVRLIEFKGVDFNGFTNTVNEIKAKFCKNKTSMTRVEEDKEIYQTTTTHGFQLKFTFECIDEEDFFDNLVKIKLKI